MRKLGGRINRSGLWRTDGADSARLQMLCWRAAGLPIGTANAVRRCCEKGAAWPRRTSTSETIEVVFSAADHRRAHRRHGAAASRKPGSTTSSSSPSSRAASCSPPTCCRALHRAGLSPQVDFLSLSSYRSGTISSGSRRDRARHRDRRRRPQRAHRRRHPGIGSHAGVRQGPDRGARGGAGANLRAARQAGAGALPRSPPISARSNVPRCLW